MPVQTRARTDNDWMDACLELAAQGEALASPNPMVGAIVVRDGEEIARAFHTYDGVKHAEVLALEQAGAAARGATLYTNLEPCSHTGRTPPCAEAVVSAGIRRVVAAMTDPNPRVNGGGFARLRAAGIEVSTGVRETEARRLNEAFACWVRTGLPLVTLKAGLTLDGKIAAPAGEKWITSEESRAEVQRLRHLSDVVITGVGTVLEDDPRLTDRTGRPRRRPLLRAVADTRLRIPLEAQLVRTAKSDVIIFASEDASPGKRRELEERGVEVMFLKEVGGKVGLRAALRELAARGLTSALLEGGATLNAHALELKLVDKVSLFYSPRLLGGSDAVPLVGGAGYRALEFAPALVDYRLHRFGLDFCVEGYLRDVYGRP